MLLKDTCETAPRILGGELDSDLDRIEQAVRGRREDIRDANGLRVARVRLKGGSRKGQEGAIKSVNPKTISIRLDSGESGTIAPVGLEVIGEETE
jgi:hypothetical protein